MLTAREGQISLDQLSLPGEIGAARVMLDQAEGEARQQRGELAFTSTLVLVGGHSLDIRW